MTELPVWHRYANEPQALCALIAGHMEEIKRDPGNAAWYRAEVDEICAHLDRRYA